MQIIYHNQFSMLHGRKTKITKNAYMNIHQRKTSTTKLRTFVCVWGLIQDSHGNQKSGEKM